MILLMNIKPGLNISIIVNIDHMREIVEVKNSIVHDVTGNKIVVAQTDPPLSRANLGRDLYVTFLEKEKGAIRRLGFVVKIVDFMNDYKLKSSQKTQVVIIRKLGNVEEYNLRMFFRLEPPRNCGLEVKVMDQHVTILDISIGGARFSHGKIDRFKVNENVKMTIEMGVLSYAVTGIIMRTWEPENEKAKKSIAFASVQFTDVQPQLKSALARKIRDIEREMREKAIYAEKQQRQPEGD